LALGQLLDKGSTRMIGRRLIMLKRLHHRYVIPHARFSLGVIIVVRNGRSNSTETLYNWKREYGGLDVNEARRLQALEDENRQLKRIVAEQALDNRVLKDLLSKNF